MQWLTYIARFGHIGVIAPPSRLPPIAPRYHDINIKNAPIVRSSRSSHVNFVSAQMTCRPAGKSKTKPGNDENGIFRDVSQRFPYFATLNVFIKLICIQSIALQIEIQLPPLIDVNCR